MGAAAAVDFRPANDPPPALANVDAEQALIGAATYDVEGFQAAEDLPPEAFYEPVHARIWRTIGELAAAGRRPDPILVADRLGPDPGLLELGGLRYLADLVDRAPPPARAAGYAAAIAELAARRQLVILAGDVSARATDRSTGSALEVLTDAESRLAEIASTGATQSAWRSAGDVIELAVAEAEVAGREPAFSTGLAELDDMTGGFTAGELAVIAGRPGMGKTVAGLAIAKASARSGRGTLFFSLEMPASALGLRLACDVAYDPEAVAFEGMGENPTFDRARRNVLTGRQWGQLRDAQRTAAEWPLLIDDRASLTVPQLEACARRAFRQWAKQGVRPGPVIVDHMGIVRPDKARGGNKVQETGDVSRGLAEMAKRLGVPVVALCQINRASEGRDDKRPSLSDLRWSGAIEEDARLVAFLHRPAYYLRTPEDPASESLAQRIEREAKLTEARHRLFFIIAKHSNGPLGQVEAFIEIGCSAIRDRRELWR